MTPMDATTDALLYALRVNALSYQQLVDGMATYVSCNYGPAAYDDFNAVACAHGLRDCAAPAPMLCETCGNDVREGSETCDGTDWLHASCDELPEYSGGTLTCDQTTCALDTTQCTMPGLDTTTGTAEPGDSSTSTWAETESGHLRLDAGPTSSWWSSRGPRMVLAPGQTWKPQRPWPLERFGSCSRDRPPSGSRPGVSARNSRAEATDRRTG